MCSEATGEQVVYQVGSRAAFLVRCPLPFRLGPQRPLSETVAPARGLSL